jgi:hypothetical protein
MIFNGKEIRVLSGAIIVFQNIPLSRTPKRKLSEAEDECLEKLFYRIMALAESEYKKIGAVSLADVRPENPTESGTIRKRLSVTLNISFSEAEVRLVSEAVDIYIAEAEARGDGKSMNVYYSGDMYGLDTDDFKRVSERIRAEMNSSPGTEAF